MKMLILSVDVGTRNFAMTLYCTRTDEYKLMELRDLRNYKDYVKTMKLLSEEEPFLSADVILVERQMRSIMKTMATAIRAFNFDKTVMVSPQCVKRFFRSSTRKHATNKKAAMVEALKLLNVKNMRLYKSFKKKDDIADCILQTHWYLSTIEKSRRMKGLQVEKKVNTGRLMKIPEYLKPKL